MEENRVENMEENKFVKGLTIGCLGFIVLIVVGVVVLINSSGFSNMLSNMDNQLEEYKAEKAREKEVSEIEAQSVIEEAEQEVIPEDEVVDLPFDKYSESANYDITDYLSRMGIVEFNNVTYLQTVDDLDVYTISCVNPPVDDIYVCINQKGYLKLVQYEKVDLYNDGDFVRNIEDVTFSETEKENVRNDVLRITTNMFDAEHCEFIDGGKDITYEMVDIETRFRRTTGKIRVYRKDGSYMDKTFINEDSTAHQSIDYDDWSM